MSWMESQIETRARLDAELTEQGWEYQYDRSQHKAQPART